MLAVAAAPAFSAVPYDSGAVSPSPGIGYQADNISAFQQAVRSRFRKPRSLPASNLAPLQTTAQPSQNWISGSLARRYAIPLRNRFATTGVQVASSHTRSMSNDSFLTGDIVLGPGTYYLALQNAAAAGLIDAPHPPNCRADRDPKLLGGLSIASSSHKRTLTPPRSR
jgi:hypothetical protein